MSTVFLIVAGTVAVTAISVAGLRIASRHHPTACPAWLVPLLENPYMNALAGSAKLLDRADVRPGMSVIDVGCGPGRVTLPAAERVGPTGRVVALDLQPAMLRKLHERLASGGVTNVEAIEAGAGEGEMPRGAFDRALLVTVLGEIMDQESALREIHAALKPGGILSVTEVLPDPHYQSRARVQRLAESTGFRKVSVLGPWYAHTMNLRREENG